MRRKSIHPTDEELLLAAEGELASSHAEEVRGHLDGCKACRARAEQMEAASADFARAHGEGRNEPLPPANFARARLKSHLAAAASGEKRGTWAGIAGLFSNGVWAYLATLAVVAAMGFGFLYQREHPANQQVIVTSTGDGPLVPNLRLTPGAVRAITASQVCSAGEAPETQPSPQIAQTVFHEYGMDGAPPQQYEVDHLITPALGGTDDIRNLWPESYSFEWNAHVKDELEDYLYSQVCQGKMDLPTAQREIATNWISAYQKHFHTDKPLRRSSGVVSDSGKKGDS